jgi:hypothetical protein
MHGTSSSKSSSSSSSACNAIDTSLASVFCIGSGLHMYAP